MVARQQIVEPRHQLVPVAQQVERDHRRDEDQRQQVGERQALPDHAFQQADQPSQRRAEALRAISLSSDRVRQIEALLQVASSTAAAGRGCAR